MFLMLATCLHTLFTLRQQGSSRRHRHHYQTLEQLHKQLKGSTKEPNMFHNYETKKITRKASDAAENLQLYRVVRFFRQRLLCMTTHLMLFSERPPIYICPRA